MPTGFEEVARGGATALTDMMKQMAPTMVQNSLQNDFRMKHLQTQLDATKEKQLADSELSLITNLWNTQDYPLILDSFDKGTWETEQANQAVTKLRPIASAKSGTIKEFRKWMADGNLKKVREESYRASAVSPALEAQVKAFLSGNVQDKRNLVNSYLSMYPNHPQADMIREVNARNPEQALALFVYNAQASAAGLTALGDILKNPEELITTDPNLYNDISRRYKDLMGSVIPGKYNMDFINATTRLGLNPEMVYNKSVEIANRIWQEHNETVEPEEQKGRIEQFVVDQLTSDPNSLAFREFMKELGIEVSTEPEEEEGKGFFQKVGETAGAALDIFGEAFKGEEVPEDVEQFATGQWELPSGEDVSIRKSGDKFTIRTTKSWINEESQRTKTKAQGSYPNWVDLSIEELRKLALQKR